MAVAVAKLDILQSPIKERKRRRRIHQSNDEITRRKALKSCFKTVEVARTQLDKDLIVQLKKQYPIDLDSYQAQSLKFLDIPEMQDVMDMWWMVDHMKKFYVVVKQMVKENSDQSEYRLSLKSTGHQISQVRESLELTAVLMTGKLPSRKGYPTLPDELKTEGSRSKRQNRDCLFVKEYNKFLETIEQALKSY